MALDFPSSPTVNQKYPASPVNGVPTYTWDGEKWTTVGGSIAGVPPGGDPPGTATPLSNITPAVVGVATKYSREDHRHPVDTSIASKVSLAGDTMTGDLTIGKTNPLLTLNKTAVAQDNGIYGKLNGVSRWMLDLGSTAAESGGGAGSDFGIYRFTDAGAYVDSVFGITRVDGKAYVNGDPIGPLGVATKQYVDAKALAASAAEYLANTASRVLSPNGVWAAAAPVAAGTSTALTPDFSTGLDFTWTYSSASGAVNNGTNLKPGQKGVIYITAGSAGCIITTWGSQYKFPGGTKPTMSTASGAIDAISYTILSSTQILCSFQGNFA